MRRLCLVLINKSVMNQADVIFLEIPEKKQQESNCGRIFFYYFIFRMNKIF